MSKPSRFLNDPDGMSADDAVRLAQFKLDGMAEHVERELADVVERLRLLFIEQAERPSAMASADLRNVSYELACTAGTFNRSGLSEAGRALCVLLDGLESRGAWDREAVRVNIDVIRLLMRSPPGGETADMLAALGRLTAHVSRT
jgi:hypothetical protein